MLVFQVTKRDDSEEAKVKALSSVVNEGEQVWIKVISLKVEDGSTKVGCSMKYVSQGDGTDLDPNNIQAEKQQSRPSWKEPQKVSTILNFSTLLINFSVACRRDLVLVPSLVLK